MGDKRIQIYLQIKKGVIHVESKQARMYPEVLNGTGDIHINAIFNHRHKLQVCVLLTHISQLQSIWWPGEHASLFQ